MNEGPAFDPSSGRLVNDQHLMTPLDRFQQLADKWRVTCETPCETPTAILAHGTRESERVVLKVIKQVGDEWHSGEILNAFHGQGMVMVYEWEPGALLLERLEPATRLAELVLRGDDEDATKIFAELLTCMAHHSPPKAACSVMDWWLGFDRYLNSGDQQVDPTLVIEARERFLELAQSQKITMLLHGDLHHYNVLFDSTRGWIAIDPKGVVGELEYEIGAIVRNPIEQPEWFTSGDVIERRLHQFADRLYLNYDRMLGWSFAQAVLAAIWDIEDGNPVNREHPHLKLANSIKQMV